MEKVNRRAGKLIIQGGSGDTHPISSLSCGLYPPSSPHCISIALEHNLKLESR